MTATFRSPELARKLFRYLTGGAVAGLVILVAGCSGSPGATQTVTVSAQGPTATATATVTATPTVEPAFEPKCGTAADPESYLEGVWEAELSPGDPTMLIFTPECNVRYDMDPPEGEWTQVGNEVKFVLVSTLDDVVGNEYRGKFISDTKITGRSDNGPFTMTRNP
jgi:hypothetical protein